MEGRQSLSVTIPRGMELYRNPKRSLHWSDSSRRPYSQAGRNRDLHHSEPRVPRSSSQLTLIPNVVPPDGPLTPASRRIRSRLSRFDQLRGGARSRPTARPAAISFRHLFQELVPPGPLPPSNAALRIEQNANSRCAVKRAASDDRRSSLPPPKRHCGSALSAFLPPQRIEVRFPPTTGAPLPPPKADAASGHRRPSGTAGDITNTHSLSQPFSRGRKCPNNTAFESATSVRERGGKPGSLGRAASFQ